MNSTTIFLYFVFACIGAAVGGLIQRSLDARKAKAAPPPAENQSAEAGAVTAQTVQEVPPTQSAPLPVTNPLAAEGDSEVLRAWRTNAGKIWLEMDHARLEDKGALQAEQRRRLLNLVVDLRPWLETAPEPARTVQVSQTSPTKPIAAAAPPAPAVIQPEDNKPKINMKSIVQQIDDVLQTKLAGTVFAPQDIHLVENIRGGVLVQIDRDKYEGIDAVPNPEIQALIRQAVADWDKSPK